MDGPECPGCRERDARIAELERRLSVLEARLKINSSNSSMPPSSDRPGDKPRSGAEQRKKKKKKRSRGGQPGHPPHLKKPFPPEQVTKVVLIVPEVCSGCQEPLPRDASPNDPEPKRHQVVELPPIVVEVTEYQAHGRTCACGVVTQATIPASIRAHSTGPALTATLSYFSGCHGVSKRGVEEIADTVLGVPLSLGTVANLEQEVSAALEPAHKEALEAVRRADVKYADETSWKLWGKLCWLWAAATSGVAVFVIHAKRSAKGLAAILGDSIEGIVHSDRWHVYLQVPEEFRQLCWAHLKRDFQKIVVTVQRF
jgi:transposase